MKSEKCKGQQKKNNRHQTLVSKGSSQSLISYKLKCSDLSSSVFSLFFFGFYSLLLTSSPLVNVHMYLKEIVTQNMIGKETT